jgi:acyl-CoA dehydrogenase
MSQFANMIDEASERAFAPFANPETWRKAERGEGFDALWRAIEESGFLDVLCTEDETPSDRGAAAFELIRNSGRALLPAPVGETIVARAVLADAKIGAPAGPMALEAARAAFGRYAKRLVQIVDGSVVSSAVREATVIGANAAGEPRDALNVAPGGQMSAISAWTADRFKAAGALVRAGQMAGAIERVLMLTVDYARTRKQFGKPIGQFQAIQQQLAVLAGQSASASAAAAHAFRRWAHRDFVMLAAAAKIRAGEAAAAANSIAHQTHGAIGITQEHELHFATRRLHSWRAEFGGETYWAEKLGAWIAGLGPDGFWARITET